MSGAVILPDALSYLECTVASRLEAGDHWILYATVDDGKVWRGGVFCGWCFMEGEGEGEGEGASCGATTGPWDPLRTPQGTTDWCGVGVGGGGGIDLPTVLCPPL